MDKQKQIEEMAKFSFSVIDNKTGEYPDTYKIALKEDWAKGLMYCDIEGFAINEEGNLVLLDECGNVAYCPSGRFTVIPEGSVVLTREEYERLWVEGYRKGKEVGCKRTAEKFAERLKAQYPPRTDRRCTLDDCYMLDKIDEICKEFTEGK